MKKIIISTVSIGIVLIVGLTALIMSLVPVGKNDFVLKPTAVYLLNTTTQKDTSYEGVRFKSNSPCYESDIEEINKIYKVFNECFTQKALTALFREELNDKVETHYEKSIGTENYIRRDGDSTHLTFVFAYDESQKIKVGDKEYDYKYLFFQIDNSTERKEIVFGVSSSATFSSSSSSYFSYSYWFTAKMNTTKLYDYIASQKYRVNGELTQIVDSRE